MNVTIPMLGLERNGGNRVLIAIANRLVERGHACEIVTPGRHRQPPGFALNEAVAVRAITPPLPTKPFRWLVFMLACCLRLRNRNILANHFVTAVAARIAAAWSAATVVYLVQDIEYRFYPRPLAWLAWLLCRFSFGLAHIVPANPYLERELARNGIATAPALRLGVAPGFLADAHAGDDKAYDVVCFIRRGRHKRPDRLAAIAAELRRHGVSIAGLAPEAALLREFKSCLDTGIVPASDRDIIAALDRARVLLLTSDHEGFALPPLEAMARGLPVVLFPCGGPEVYASHEYNALIVSDRRNDTAVAHIQTLLGDSERYAALSSNAQATARRFNLNDATSEFVTRLEQTFA